MRKILISLAAVVTAIAATFTQAGPALAADTVSGLRCVTTDTSLGTICVWAWFDNTNCDAHSLDNCSGLNGATLYRVEIQTSKGTPALRDVQMSLDTYGDHTSEYGQKYLLDFTYDSPGLWSAAIPSASHPNVNRVCVRVRSAAVSATSGINIGGMNPYDISQAGACNLPS